ncbi:hypothetical protein AAFF_G00242230 [Aldrovandia affinis]|uniref:Uncharacterized protein n=1 Tax=Aldrovandia affinis TaxID=143900 RepID=A0AAD7SUT1_9TELE|nr:hypothetical protein AAFF_G00242230 [Aldrovandia affinis]
MDPSHHSTILLVIMVTMLILLLGLILWVLHYCRVRSRRQKKAVPGWPGVRLALRDQATSTTSLSVAMAIFLKHHETPSATAHSFSSWAELSESKEAAGGFGPQTLRSSIQESCSVGLAADDASLGLESRGLLHSTSQVYWRPGLEPSLLSGVQRMPGSTINVVGEEFALEKPSGSASLPHQKQQERLSSSLRTPEIHQCPSLPMLAESPVLELSHVGANQTGYFSPPSPRSLREPSAVSPGRPGDAVPTTALELGPERSRRASGVSESSSVLSTLTQASEAASLVGAEAAGQAASERSLLERARCSSLFQRPRAWFISMADAMPKPGGAGSVDSGVDMQDVTQRSRPGETGFPGAPLNGARAEAVDTEEGRGDGRQTEVVICPREAALKLGRSSGPSLWQKWEERPLIAIN